MLHACLCWYQIWRGDRKEELHRHHQHYHRYYCYQDIICISWFTHFSVAMLGHYLKQFKWTNQPLYFCFKFNIYSIDFFCQEINKPTPIVKWTGRGQSHTLLVSYMVIPVMTFTTVLSYCFVAWTFSESLHFPFLLKICSLRHVWLLFLANKRGHVVLS